MLQVSLILPVQFYSIFLFWRSSAALLFILTPRILFLVLSVLRNSVTFFLSPQVGSLPIFFLLLPPRIRWTSTLVPVLPEIRLRLSFPLTFFLSPQVGSLPRWGLYPSGLARLAFRSNALRAENGVSVTLLLVILWRGLDTGVWGCSAGVLIGFRSVTLDVTLGLVAVLTPTWARSYCCCVQEKTGAGPGRC